MRVESETLLATGNNILKSNIYLYKVNDQTYCLRHKRYTDDLNSTIKRAKTNRAMKISTCSVCGENKSKFMKLEGDGIDIHKAIGCLPKPKGDGSQVIVNI